MRRRVFLLGGSAAPLIASCAAPRAAPSGRDAAGAMPSYDTGSGPMVAIVEYQGTTYRYDEANGDDLGDYVDPRKRFVQGCKRVAHEKLPLTVYFRRDRGSERAEAVFELGRIWSQAAPANLDAYKASIMRNGRVVFTTEVPEHFWHSRWRWQSAPRPVTQSPAELIAAGLLPHYDGSVCPFTPASKPFTYSPMTLAGLAPNGGMTGERGDIGLVTEWQADYICTGKNLATVLAQGEAMNTFPVCFRDEHTGGPLDALKYAGASTYPGAGGSPQVAVVPGTRLRGIPLTLDPAHEPEGSYLPFLLTGDPYYLEMMQFQDVFNLVKLPPHARYRTTGGVRAFAWSLRTAGRLAKVTPADVPNWLLPQSYFAKVLANYVAFLQASVESADPRCRNFSVIQQSATTSFDFWQGDFITAVLCDLVRMGATSCLPGLTWAVKSNIARCDGVSGWRRADQSVYNVILQPTPASPVPATWDALWTLNHSLQPEFTTFAPDDATGNALLSLPKGGMITYASYCRGVLAMAARLEIAETRPCFEWIDQQIRRNLKAGVRVDYKWCIT